MNRHDSTTHPSDDLPTLRARVEARAREALVAYLAEHASAPEALPPIDVEQPRDSRHGDWAVSVALRLAKALRRPPLAIAEGIAKRWPQDPCLGAPEVASPGYLNLRLTSYGAADIVRRVLVQGDAYGRSQRFAGRRALIEFVSANPTGPLHIGHGRGAVVGDTLARAFEAAGYTVAREYYYNDAGVQMKLLGASLRARYLQQLGEEAPLPENGYRGDYMIDLARELVAQHGSAWRTMEDLEPFTRFAADRIMASIRADLDALRIRFDSYFSETSLHRQGKVDAVLERLRAQGRVYEQDGAWWLRSTDYGDEKDRVVRKSNGEYTYLAPDIAYHEDKFARGFDELVNVLGADHHSYVTRLKAAVAALGYPAERLHCVLTQMVAVRRGGEAMKLSTRAGDFITLKEVLDEIGTDVTRFLFLTRAADSQMVFDFDVARDTSMDNPVYYVQYAHARCCSLMRKAAEAGLAPASPDEVDPAHLTAAEERAIARQIDRLPEVVLEVVLTVEPMPLTAYLRDLATSFHTYFTEGNKHEAMRVVRPDAPQTSRQRLALIAALRITLANALHLLGVEPLERL